MSSSRRACRSFGALGTSTSSSCARACSATQSARRRKSCRPRRAVWSLTKTCKAAGAPFVAANERAKSHFGSKRGLRQRGASVLDLQPVLTLIHHEVCLSCVGRPVLETRGAHGGVWRAGEG